MADFVSLCLRINSNILLWLSFNSSNTSSLSDLFFFIFKDSLFTNSLFSAFSIFSILLSFANYLGGFFFNWLMKGFDCFLSLFFSNELTSAPFTYFTTYLSITYTSSTPSVSDFEFYNGGLAWSGWWSSDYDLVSDDVYILFYTFATFLKSTSSFALSSFDELSF